MTRYFVAVAGAMLLGSTGVGSAQVIALFGDARLGLGYNINSAGDATGQNDFRAISRVRFGVSMTGETDSGISFGAIIRADNAVAGEGGEIGQRAGSVFVSGDWGTLTFGDTNGADEQNVGDLNEVGLTCLGCENETLFISNGGGFGDDEEVNFANDPLARPTVRFDYAWSDFLFSLSANRNLDDVGVGASWSGEVGGGTVTVGGGYYDYSQFIATSQEAVVSTLDVNGEPVQVIGVAEEFVVPPGHQWSAALGGGLGAFNGTVIYTTADSEGDADFSTLGAGLGAGFGAWALNFYYVSILDAGGSVAAFDGEHSVGFGVNYDAGGGTLVRMGVVDTYADESVGDFGISMAF